MLSTGHSLAPGSDQLGWLEADLAAANAAENLNARPWVLVRGHCPPADLLARRRLRQALGEVPESTRTPDLDGPDGLLGLLARRRVDAALWGHLHAYERTLRLVNQRLADPGPPRPGPCTC